MATIYITKLGRHKAIFGTLQITEHTVFPNLFNNIIMFSNGHCDYWGTDYSAVPPITELIDKSLPKHKRGKKQQAPAIIVILHIAPAVTFPPAPAKPLLIPTENEQKFKVYFVNAIGYKRNMADPDVNCFAISMEELDQTIALSQKDESIIVYFIAAYDDRLDLINPMEEVLEKLLIEYHIFADVFDRTQTDKLFPYRKYNYKVELFSDANPVRSRFYPMSGFKLQKTREYLTGMLEKGFIEPS